MRREMTDEPLSEPAADTAAAWVGRLAAELDIDPLTLLDQATVLAIARDVAHGTERKCAPLAAFVAGRYVQAATDAGRDPSGALREVSEAVARLLEGLPATR